MAPSDEWMPHQVRHDRLRRHAHAWRRLAVVMLVALTFPALAEPLCKGSREVRECRVFHDAVVFQRSVDGIIAFSQVYSADAP
jgi:hypothetical protein